MRLRHVLLVTVGALLPLAMVGSPEPSRSSPPAETQPAALRATIGAKIDNLQFKDIRFLQRSLADFPKAKAFVFVFVDAACPLVPRYLPTLKKLEKQYRDKGVQFLAVNSSADDTILEMANQAVEHSVDFPFVRDIDGKCATTLGAERTPEVVLLDAERIIRYRGRIDDQYTPGAARKEPTRNDLKEAIDEMLAGKKVTVETTTVDGCKIARAARNPADPVPTFNADVAPVVHQHCASCHRPDTGTPFALLTYEQVRKKGDAIAEVVADGKMPPWYADPAHEKMFTNRRGLTAAERDTIVRWVNGDMPRGAGPAPNPPEFPKPNKDGWVIGEPDLILETEVHDLPATGDIEYHYSALPKIFYFETWLESIQILPSNPKVVHHANLAYGSPGHGVGEANFITGYVPGTPATKLDDGKAFRLPPASVLGLQIHYVNDSGLPEKCRVRVGLRFARGVVHQQVRFVLMDSTRFTIPAQAPHHPVHLTRPLEHDAEAVGIFAHMHLRGKAMVFRAVPPNGEPQTLLTIPNYNFNWQLSYLYEPGKLKLPKGTRLECDAIFDNSSFNRYNPDANAQVRYGRQTWQEMINGFFFYVDANEDLNLSVDPKTGRGKYKEEAEKKE
jgi:mono/diheme cytochrome c family protein/alkyl hydroperoxide reductase subunit AhpC